jgi:hypothetical protein
MEDRGERNICGTYRQERDAAHLAVRWLTQSLCAANFIKKNKETTDMSNTSNKINKSSETYCRKTLDEQEEAFWLLGELQQELARAQETRHVERGIASEAYKYVAGENDLTVKATVKVGRYPGSFELVGIQS